MAILPVYREFLPPSSLAPAVECFWTSSIRGTERRRSFHRVLPDGCLDLLFDFTAFGSQRASVVGTMTRPLVVNTTGTVDLLGVRFRPGFITAFVPANASELTDCVVDLANFWGGLASSVWEQLAETAPGARVRLLQECLHSKRNGQTRVDPWLRHCLIEIAASRGALPIGSLERKTGFSTRQLERKFARHVGISPKVFARVVRFRSLAGAAARLRSPHWAGLAADFGFADQSHLVREFKLFSGRTPAAYFRENLPLA